MGTALQCNPKSKSDQKANNEAINMKLYVAILAFLGLCNVVLSQSTKTMDFSKEAGSNEVRYALIGLKIPNQYGSKGIDYAVRNIKITDFNAKTATLSNPSGTDFRVQLGGIRLSGQADVEGWKTIKIWFFKKTIRAKAKAYITFEDVSISQGARLTLLGQSVKGSPTTCSAYIRKVNVRLDGQDFLGSVLSGIFNLLKGLFDGKIRSMFTGMICPAIKSQLTKYMTQLDVVFQQLMGDLMG